MEAIMMLLRNFLTKRVEPSEDTCHCRSKICLFVVLLRRRHVRAYQLTLTPTLCHSLQLEPIQNLKGNYKYSRCPFGV